MTDRSRTLTVVLNNDYRDDDVQPIIDAILMIKGVTDVSTAVTSGSDYVNRSAIALEYEQGIHKALKDLRAAIKKKPKPTY